MTDTATTPRRDSEGESRLRVVRRVARLAVVGGGMIIAGFVGTQLAHADAGSAVTGQVAKASGPAAQAPMHVVEQADRVISLAPAVVQGITAAVVPTLDSTVHNDVGSVTAAVTGTVASLHGELAPVTDLVGTLLDTSPATATTATAPAPHTVTSAGRSVAARTSVPTVSAPRTGVDSVRRAGRGHTSAPGAYLTPGGSTPAPSGPAQDPAPVPTGATISPTLRHIEALRTLVVGPETAWRTDLHSTATTASRVTTTEPLLAYGSSRPD